MPRLAVIIGQQMRPRGRHRATQARHARARPGARCSGDRGDERCRSRGPPERVREYEAAAIESGVIVKDPRIGLCDFYGLVDGKHVWLCWRYGEEAVEHYHDLDDGLRRPQAAIAAGPAAHAQLNG